MAQRELQVIKDLIDIQWQKNEERWLKKDKEQWQKNEERWLKKDQEQLMKEEEARLKHEEERRRDEMVVELLFTNHLKNVCYNIVKYLCWLVPLPEGRARMGFRKRDFFRKNAFSCFPEVSAKVTPRVAELLGCCSPVHAVKVLEHHVRSRNAVAHPGSEVALFKEVDQCIAVIAARNYKSLFADEFCLLSSARELVDCFK